MSSRGPDLIILAVAWEFVAAFLWLVGIAAAALFAFPFSPGYQGTQVEVGDIFGMVVGTLLLVACMTTSMAGAIGLLRRQRRGRLFGIAGAALSLFLVPIGTVLGTLVLLYLLKREVRDYFESST